MYALDLLGFGYSEKARTNYTNGKVRYVSGQELQARALVANTKGEAPLPGTASMILTPVTAQPLIPVGLYCHAKIANTDQIPSGFHIALAEWH